MSGFCTRGALACLTTWQLLPAPEVRRLRVGRSEASRIGWQLRVRRHSTCYGCGTAVAQVTSNVYIDRKEVDDVLGGEDAWKNADRTDGGARALPFISSSLCAIVRECTVHLWLRLICLHMRHVNRSAPAHSYGLLAFLAASCPKCSYHRAYYQQLQIRSADEPMTTFYKRTWPRLRSRTDSGRYSMPCQTLATGKKRGSR
eukprot:6174412-Pleurochrysis_carterae.AAC.4